MGGLSCPRCGADRLDRLARNELSPVRGYRCARCGRRLRDRGSAPTYLAVLAVGAGVTALGVGAAGEEGGLGRGAGAAVGAACVAYAAVELTRPVPRVSRPARTADAASADGWYYARGGARVGPLGLDQLRRLAAAGEVAPNDMVFEPGAGAWVSAGTVPGLLPGPADR
jgi:hypothetical protein